MSSFLLRKLCIQVEFIITSFQSKAFRTYIRKVFTSTHSYKFCILMYALQILFKFLYICEMPSFEYFSNKIQLICIGFAREAILIVEPI